MPDGSVHGFLADHRRELFPDGLFADLFGSGRGRPSVPADQVATVMVLGALEGLSDREATRQLACNIAWKVACGLALTDRGFHPRVLTLWRTRLRASDRPERILEAVRAVITQTGVLAGRQRRALDSTLVDDAVATQDTVTQLVAAIRRVRRLVPAAGGWCLAAHDYDHDPGKPACAWDDPEARTRLVSALVNDARAVLDAVGGAELDTSQAEAVGLVGLVAGQDVEPGEQAGTFRVARKVAADRVISMVDPDARHLHKSRSSYRDGYKAHLAVEPETGLVCAAALTPANAADGPTALGCWPGSRPGSRCLATRPMGAERPGRRFGRPGMRRRSSRSRCSGGAGQHYQRRLRRRPAGQDGDLPGRPYRGDHAERPGGVRLALWPVSAAGALHPRQGRQDPQPGTARGRTGGGPPPRRRPGVPGELPPLATDGGVLDRLAGRRGTAECATAA